MMDFNENLVSELEFDELDMGEIFMYSKEGKTRTLKGYSSFFKIGRQMIFNNRFNVPEEYKHTTRVYVGKKGRGMAFSASFADFQSGSNSNTVRYCYEMEKEAIKSGKKYLAGNY
jgi:hypothetical protein